MKNIFISGGADSIGVNLFRALFTKRAKIRIPFGQFSANAVKVVREIGYLIAVVPGKKLLDNFDMYFLLRLAMTRDLNLKNFQDIFSYTNLIRTLIRYGPALKRSFHNSR